MVTQVKICKIYNKLKKLYRFKFFLTLIKVRLVKGGSGNRCEGGDGGGVGGEGVRRIVRPPAPFSDMDLSNVFVN